eukprot:s758_g25.t1
MTDGEPLGSEMNACYGEQKGSVEFKDLTVGTCAGSARPACGVALVPDPSNEAGSDGTTGPDERAVVFTPEGNTFGMMAKNLFTMFDNLENSCKVWRSKVKFSGGIFPLPECPRAISEVLGQLPEEHLAGLRCVFKALNSYSGVKATDRPLLSAAAKMAMRSLSKTIHDSGLTQEKFEGVSWENLMKVKTVDYRGEEIQVAKRFRWENIEPALPDGIGSIPLSEVCEGESRVYTKPPKIFVDDDAWEQVCSGLLRKGVCRIIRESEVYHLDNKPILNGLFGVSKCEYQAFVEIHRLIMNLVPVNKLCRSLGSDVSTLPSVTGLGSIILEDNEVLVLNSEDIRCFFYLFQVPVGWHKFLAFGRQVPSSLLAGHPQEPHYLASLVLPMGFVSSVSIAQHVHRRIARLSLHGISPHIGPQCEMRRDKPGSTSPWLYRIYLDNFDALQKVDSRLAGLIQGEPSLEALALREGYHHWGLPRHPKKSVEQALVAEIQGALVDGKTGHVRPKPSKVLKYVELGIDLVKTGWATQKQMQIICGGFVYCAMFRRSMLGMLNRVWSLIMEFEGDPPVVRRELPDLVKLELVRFACTVPLAQMNLRALFRGDVTCSDASEWGGGFCISNGLTAMGVHAAQCQVRGDVPDVDDHVQVLTIGLFDGIGALRVGADVLKLPMAGHVSAEVSPEGSRVLEANFADSLQVGAVENITEETVMQWAVKYSNVGLVLVGGGPPCQGVSGLNADRKGALRDARSSLFVHVKRVYLLVKQKFPWAQVHYLMESVFSMDEQDRAIMSEHMETTPLMIDAACIAVCRRPRLYWVSWEIAESPEVTLVDKGSGQWTRYTEVLLRETVDPAKFIQRGWTLSGDKLPTFTTARPRLSPGNKPAGLWQCEAWEVERWEKDLHRFPPYVYRDKHCLTNGQGDFRLPSIQEKEVMMGFPVDYTACCMPKSKQTGVAFQDARHSLVGNSWCVPVIAWLMKELCAPLGLTPIRSLGEVVAATSPGQDISLQGYLRRPPLQALTGVVPAIAEEVLTKKLVNFISVKGEDLLLQAESENNVKFQRLRTSVPAKLWKWKTICGWPWARPGYHINVLEARKVVAFALLALVLVTFRYASCLGGAFVKPPKVHGWQIHLLKMHKNHLPISWDHRTMAPSPRVSVRFLCLGVALGAWRCCSDRGQWSFTGKWGAVQRTSRGARVLRLRAVPELCVFDLDA